MLEKGALPCRIIQIFTVSVIFIVLAIAYNNGKVIAENFGNSDITTIGRHE